MFCYHWEHPFQYISLVAFVYGVVASAFAHALRSQNKTSRLAVVLIMAVTIIVASPIGGVLWVIHDMQAGYFPEGTRFRSHLIWGAFEGIQSGWLIILLSIPYNLLGLIVGYFATSHGLKLARLTSFPKSSLPKLSQPRAKPDRDFKIETRA